jgi:branched-chain amino acid transport system substrate-binding protein
MKTKTQRQLARQVFLSSVLAMAFSAAHAEEPIKIGVVSPITGKSSTDKGESIIDAARTFAANYNSAGGLFGRKIVLVERDDKSDPALGVEIMKEFINKEHVVAVIGFGNTGVAIPSVKLLQQAKIPVIATAVTGIDVVRQFANAKPSYVFRVGASDALQPIALINDLVDRRGLLKIAFFNDTSGYGKLGREAVLAEFKRRNMEPVVVDSFDVGQTDMSALVSKAQSANAQAIMVYGQGTEAAMITLAMAKAKYKVPLVGPWALSEKAFASIAGPSGEGTRMSVDYIEDTVDTRRAEFLDAYLRVNKVDRMLAPAAAAQTYDALLLLTTAMAQANSTDGELVRDALENLQYSVHGGIVTTYRTPFSPTNHEATPMEALMIGEIRNSKVVYAYHEDSLRRIEGTAKN